MGKWETIEKKTIYRNEWISLNVDAVRQPDGNDGQYSVINTSDTISIIVKDDDNKIRFVYLHRYPINAYSWEVIKGRMDGDSPIDAAKRELAEEMSLEANKWTALGHFNPFNGLCGELNTVFLAEKLTTCDTNMREEEGIAEIKSFSLAKIDNMITNNEIKDSFTISAIYKYKLFLESKHD